MKILIISRLCEPRTGPKNNFWEVYKRGNGIEVKEDLDYIDNVMF